MSQEGALYVFYQPEHVRGKHDSVVIFVLQQFWMGKNGMKPFQDGMKPSKTKDSTFSTY